MTQRLPSGHPAAVYASIQEYRLVLREFCDRWGEALGTKLGW